ncbi:MAG: GH92 family glycosyl hydrolase [Bacteroidales bacterium]|nr:GH92 family glycosyl hydrolase [Bacteroidales bacterium]MBQ8048331.1 GH92 family glycosyl hydrolase [Bacteroidales bacterium]
MIKRLLIAALVLVGCRQEPELVTEPADYASTLVGTLSEHSFSTGNTYPAIALPWGMNFWTPVTGKMGDGWAYRYDAHHIRGFKQTHQPSPWINDYGQFAIMPVRDAEKVDQNARASWFSHHSETARPYYYQVYLADHDINVEIAPTERAASLLFTFPESETSGIIVDAYDEGSYIKVLPEKNAIIGYTTKNSGGVPENFRNWFVVKFDKPVEGYTVYDGPSKAIEGALESEGDHALAVVTFKTARWEKVNVQTASSFISLEQAWTNFKELEGKCFAEVRDAAKARWNDVLGRIQVGGGTDDQYRTFYSCLYRSVLFPRKFYEINEDGDIVHYSPYNGEVCDGYLYTDTGFWDTFRALFPLLNLVYPSVNAEIQQGLANIARENCFLPEWASPGHRDCMVGNNSASVVADAIISGVTPEKDWQTLYDCLVYGTEHVHPEISSTGRLGHEYYNTLGYIPCDVGINESVARTLEYAYNDWCILQIAKKLGRPADEIEKWESRSDNWKNVFDPSHKLMRGRNLDGSFQEPFSPYKWGGVFTEGNAWHYTWSVFHDVEGLMEAMGGKEEFVRMLDSVFVVPPIYDDSYYGYRIHEITEMQVANMGNYAHGNQPAQHMIYLYNWAGEHHKTEKRVREVMERLYKATPDGYCGDEDNGQTSAWYVFSALGFYPVCPASGEYAEGAPLFERFVIHRDDGSVITDFKNISL